MKRILTILAAFTASAVLSASVFAQSGKYEVKGVIVDALGPVIGATVLEQGTTNGTSTDLDGNYSLTVSSADAIVEFRCIGYSTQTFKASDVPATVTFVEDAEFLDEVVVIGYGTVKKSDLTGSVTALRPDTKNKGVVVNPQDMLTGKIAGVAVTSDGGAPGGASNIRIRGGSSLNASNNPLIVIDGLAIDNNGVKGLSNALSLVNPADIESFNVLKDASATAIYGSRGSNGVIIITTKKGMANQAPKVTYSGSFTVSTRRKSVDVLNGDEYRSLINSLFAPDDPAVLAMGKANTDWQSEIYRTAFGQDHNVTLTGSIKALPYRVSVGYTGDQGILKTSDFKRLTGSLNLNPTFFDKHLTVNVSGKSMVAWTSYANSRAIGDAIRMDPTQSIYDKTSADAANFGGYFQWRANSEYKDASWPTTWERNAPANPVADLDQNLYSDKARSTAYIGSVEMDYKIHGFEDLHLHLNLGGDLSSGKQTTIGSRSNPTSIYYGYNGWEQINKRNSSLTAYAQYLKDFNENHHFDIMAGYEWQHFWREVFTQNWGTYPETATTGTPGSKYNAYDHTYRTENYLVSFLGRANYSYKDKYLLTGTVRYDGSSRFAQHWALFPSFAFAWRIKEEPFLKYSEAVSDLKLRLGYGQTGQQEGIGDYYYFPLYKQNDGNRTYYPVTGNGTLYRPEVYNKDLKWETTTTYNVGLDFGFANDRLTGSIDAYYRHTTDLINTANVAAGSTFRNQQLTNIGSLVNKGIEFSFDWKAVQTRDWFWTISGNATYNHNEITELIGGDEDYYVATGGISAGTGGTIQAHAVGHPANSFLVYQQVYDKNGKPLEGVVVDRNGDGTISEKDMYYFHSPHAPMTFGLSTRLEYKNWDFGMNFRANVGNYVYNDLFAGQANVSYNALWAQSTYLGNRPRASLANNWQTYDIEATHSDMYVKNASFLKCDNITLGYSFSSLFKGGNYDGIGGRVYATANNVFCITKYEGIDPEVFGGIDNNIYPRPFSVIFGVNLNF
ncbi:MAG: TonB-dependent receptor [Bacteroidales bacterium]|nr:TonB-dependent receptor [Bacteroidales bacterium]